MKTWIAAILYHGRPIVHHEGPIVIARTPDRLLPALNRIRWRPMRWWQDRTRITCALLFLLGFAVLAIVSGDRLKKQSPDPHFVLQADAWLKGKLSIDPPWKGDDPAKVETVLLNNGEQVRGRYLKTRGWVVGSPWLERAIRDPKVGKQRMPRVRFFRTTAGVDIPQSEVARSIKTDNYVSFPPVPALLMLPQTAVHGRIANDVFPTLLIAALILPLCFLTLRRLAQEGLSNRSDSDNIWLSLQLSFGSVLFFVSVAGRVWFTAHVVGVAFALGYAYFSIGARRPLLAGLMLGLAALSRTPMAFMFPFFALEACRSVAGEDWHKNWRQSLAMHWRSLSVLYLKFAAPILVLATIACIHNYLRFDNPTEFGHSFLAVRQQGMIENHGLFDYEYLRRNLSVAFTLLPNFNSVAPYIHISGHGMALWITTPLFVLLLWPKKRGHIHTALWLTVALIAIPILFYQNSGWVQFGYRFSLDFTVFLLLLFAIGNRKLSKMVKGFIVLSIIINLFGAYTFGRHFEYYNGGSYDVVIPHHPK